MHLADSSVVASFFIMLVPCSFGSLYCLMSLNPVWMGEAWENKRHQIIFVQLIIATTPNAKTKKSPSILTDDNIKLLFEIQKKVVTFYIICMLHYSMSKYSSFLFCISFAQNKLPQVDGIRANYSGSAVSLTDICMKPLGQACATQSVLQVFAYLRLICWLLQTWENRFSGWVSLACPNFWEHLFVFQKCFFRWRILHFTFTFIVC